MKKNTLKMTPLDLFLKITNFTLLLFLVLVTLYPFWDIIVKSFMTDGDIIKGKFVLWPTHFQFAGYKTIFTDNTYNFGLAFANSIFITVVDTIYQLLITALAAYAFTRKGLPCRKFLFGYYIFTMYFGGGMVPYYLVVKSLNLYDTYAVMIIPLFLSVFNMLVMKSFFDKLPKELEEAAIVDGAGDITVFVKIVFPLSKAVLATIALFIAVGQWNNWYSALLFIQDPTKRPLAYALQVIIEKSQGTNSDGAGGMPGQQVIGKSIQYAAIVVTVLPIMLVYPFFQKHFTKGVLIGSVKD